MGACYTVRIKMRFTNQIDKADEKAMAAMREYIKEHDGIDADFNLRKFEDAGVGTTLFDDLLQICFGSTQNCTPEMKMCRKWFRYYNDFDASYGWERIMIDIFSLMSPFLIDQSELYIYPDADYDHLVVRNGKCVQVH